MTPVAPTGDLASEPGGATQAGAVLASTGTTTPRLDLPLPADDRLVVIGQAPSNNDPDKPLFPYPPGCSGWRLAKMMGVSPWRFLSKTVRLNVFYEAPGPIGYFPVAEARERAAEIAPYLAGRRVVFLGKGVADVFGWRDAELLTWHLVPVANAWAVGAVVPHPSVGNRWYNDPDNRAAACAFLKTVLEVQPISPIRRAGA